MPRIKFSIWVPGLFNMTDIIHRGHTTNCYSQDEAEAKILEIYREEVRKWEKFCEEYEKEEA